MAERINRVWVVAGDYGAGQWLAGLLGRDLLIQVAGVSQALEAVRALDTLDCILVDIDRLELPGGLPGAVRAFRQAAPKVSVIFLASNAEPVRSSLAAGAAGWLVKEEIGYGVASAIRLVRRGGFWVTPMAARQAAEQENLRVLPCWSPNPGLTPQQVRVCELRLVYGLSSRAAGRMLGLASETVEKYISQAYGILANSHWADDDAFINLLIQRQAERARRGKELTEEFGFMYFTALQRRTVPQNLIALEQELG